MRFSVITIAYNVEKVIGKTLQSVLEQSFSDFEYIIVDGKSADNTTSIIRAYLPEFKKKGINVKFTSETDKGISDAFNKGIKQASGEIIAIINGGDCLLRDALYRVDKYMPPTVDVIYGNIIWNSITDNIKYIRKSKKDLSKLMYNMDIMHPASFVRKKCYDLAGLFDISYKYAMDQELLVRMQKRGVTFFYVDEEFVEMESGGVSDNQLWKVLKETSRIPKKYHAPLWKINFYMLYKYLKNKMSRYYRKLYN